VEELYAVATSYEISLTYDKPVYVERRELPRRVLDRTQCMIFGLLLERLTQNGVHIDIIKSRLELSFAEVDSAIERCWKKVYFLLLLMLIYSILLTIFPEHDSYSWITGGID